MEIEPLGINHLERVRKLATDEKYILPKNIHDYWTYQEFGISFIALNRNKIVGFVLALQDPKRREKVYVENILVNEEQRQRAKIGASLLLKAFEEGEKAGCTFAWGCVNPQNKGMFTFLEKFGIPNISQDAENCMSMTGKKIVKSDEASYVTNARGMGISLAIVGVELTEEYLRKLKDYTEGKDVTF